MNKDWTTIEGIPLRYEDMTSSHLVNVLIRHVLPSARENIRAAQQVHDIYAELKSRGPEIYVTEVFEEGSELYAVFAIGGNHSTLIFSDYQRAEEYKDNLLEMADYRDLYGTVYVAAIRSIDLLGQLPEHVEDNEDEA